jgi:hypothetical protein
MEELAADCAQNFLVPVVAAYIGFGWKRTATDSSKWLPEDRMLISELIVTAFFVQVGYLVPPLWKKWVNGLELDYIERQAQEARIGLLLVVLLALVASAHAMRWYSSHAQMSVEVADLLSAVGIAFLGLLLVCNNLLTPALQNGAPLP